MLWQDRYVARLRKLPGWILSNEESVRREAAPYREMTPERRLALGAAACKSAMRLALATTGPAIVFGYRDPLPEPSRRALERLRARWRAGRR